MTYLVALISSIVTGALLAVGAYAMGVHQSDVLFAIGIIGGGIQWIILIGWYLYYMKRRSKPVND